MQSSSRSPVVALLLVCAALALWLWLRAQGDAWDFAINWLAASGGQAGLSLYDAAALHLLTPGVPPLFAPIFTHTFLSYITPPSTALIYLPLVDLPYDQALALYRAASIAALLGAVGLAGYAVAPAGRLRAWLAGGFALVLLVPVYISLQLGQVDAWVVLALAAALMAIRREAWGWAGVCIAVAVCLKVTPVLLLLYLLWQRRWRAAAGAGAVLFVVIGLTVLWGHGGDWGVWLTRTLPAISEGSAANANIALPATLARLLWPLVSSEPLLLGNFGPDAGPLGPFRWLAPLIMALGLVAVTWRRPPRPEPLAAAILIVVALLAGPVAWLHYITWAVLPLMLLAGDEAWAAWPSRVRLEVGAVLFVVVIALNLGVWTSPGLVITWTTAVTIWTRAWPGSPPS